MWREVGQDRRRIQPNTYRNLCGQPLPAATADLIGRDLHLDRSMGTSHGRLLPQLPRYQNSAGREGLRRVLASIAKANPDMGYIPAFAQITAAIMNLIDDEEETYFFVQWILESQDLKSYYIPPHTYLHEDVDKVWNELHVMWPSVKSVFLKHDDPGAPHFVALVQRWLVSLFTLSIGKQSFENFVPFFHRIISDDIDVENPRQGLRYAVICALGRYCEEFEAVTSKDDLALLVGDLQSELNVDPLLLGFYDEKADLQTVGMLGVAMALPTGLWAGWTAGLGVASWTTGLTTVAGAMAVPAAGFYAGSGLILGGCVSTVLGWYSARELARQDWVQSASIRDQDEPDAEDTLTG